MTCFRTRCANRLHCVPIAIDGESIYLAVADRLGEGEAEVEGYTGRKVQQFLATPQRDFHPSAPDQPRPATPRPQPLGLRERFPDSSAHQVLSGGQKVFLVILVLVFLGCLIWQPIQTLVVVFALLAIFYTLTSAYKLIAGYAALGHRYMVETDAETLAAMDERNLPVYTVLVPLFREAAVIPYLVAGIESLDYPKTKLDVRLLCEEDDDETIQAIMDLDLPPHFNAIIVPPSQPQTKPKACNFGLLGRQGRIRRHLRRRGPARSAPAQEGRPHVRKRGRLDRLHPVEAQLLQPADEHPHPLVLDRVLDALRPACCPGSTPAATRFRSAAPRTTSGATNSSKSEAGIRTTSPRTPISASGSIRPATARR